MMSTSEVSRSKFRTLVETVYFKCAECCEKREDEILILPCIHVVCKACVRSALQRAQEATTLPKKLQPTKYQDSRRFECPVCSWPQYAFYDSDGQLAYPNKLPLHLELLTSMEEEKQEQKDHHRPPKVYPQGEHQGGNKPSFQYSFYQASHEEENEEKGEVVEEKGEVAGVEEAEDLYIYEGRMGSFGSRVQKGQMRGIMGLAVDDEYRPDHPLVVVCESRSNVLLSFHLLSGKLEQARKVGVKIRDVCIAEKGTVVATVAEESYSLAKWDSALTTSGIRHENLFRDNYGHRAQIDSEPFGVARDPQGRFSVTMLAKDRVCRWDEGRSGDHILWFGDTGTSGTGLAGPYHVAKLSNGYSVVSSTADHKVKVVEDEADRLVTEIGGLGCRLLDLCFPRGVCVDGRDNIYIADTGNFRVVVYDKNGEFLSCAVSETWNYGSDVKPTNMAVARDGRLVVAMQGRGYCRVHVYLPPRRGRRERGSGRERADSGGEGGGGVSVTGPSAGLGSYVPRAAMTTRV